MYQVGNQNNFDCVLKYRLSYYLDKGNNLFLITQIIIHFFIQSCCFVVWLFIHSTKCEE